MNTFKNTLDKKEIISYEDSLSLKILCLLATVEIKTGLHHALIIVGREDFNPVVTLNNTKKQMNVSQPLH